MVQTTKVEVTILSAKRRRTRVACEEWSRIVCWYCNAVRIYSDTTDALGLRENSELTAAWEASEEARKACARFRAALLEHEFKHGCQVPAPSIFQNEVTQHARNRA